MTTAKNRREQSNYRLTETARALLAKIAESIGPTISAAAALEIIIREAAKSRGITE